MTIVVTGGSGFIGTKLTRALLDKGHTVIVVDIKAPSFTHEKLFFINCDLTTQTLPYNVLDRTDAVIHLVGASIVRKWNESIKEEIKKSRIESTKRIVESIKNTESRPTVFICASSIAFYGDTGEDPVDEQGEMGKGFLAELVAAWEAEAREAVEYGVRVVCVRSAPVLGKGKYLSSLLRTTRFGFLLKPTKKDNWMSWIHEEDIINVYLFALETSTLQGVVNAAAPHNVSVNTFFGQAGRVMKRRVLGTMPHWIAKSTYGEFYEELVKNKLVTPKRLLDKGFVFAHPTLEEALQSLMKK